MALGDFLGSRKARQTMAAIAALGVLQIPLMSLAGAPAQTVQKADQQKKKKKKTAARTAPRRAVEQTQTVTRAPDAPVEMAQAQSQPVLQAAPVAQPPALPSAPAPVAPPPAPAAITVAAAAQGGLNLVFPLMGLLGLGGLVAAVGSDSNG